MQISSYLVVESRSFSDQAQATSGMAQVRIPRYSDSGYLRGTKKSWHIEFEVGLRNKAQAENLLSGDNTRPIWETFI